MLRFVGILALVFTLPMARATAQAAETGGALARPPTQAESAAMPAAPSPYETLPPPTLPPTPTGAASTPETVETGDVEARMDALEDHLSTLGARRSSNVGGGLVSLLLGGTYIGLGVYANRNDAPRGVAQYFYIAGTAGVISAGITFGLQPNAERAYMRFSTVRDDDSLSPAERLRRSEEILHSLARRRMAGRFTQGGIDLGVTALSLPFLLGGDGFDKSDGFDWVITISATIGAINAISTMVQRTEEERRWRMYRRLAESHGGDAVFTSEAARPRLRLVGFGVSPIPGGGSGSAAFIF